MKQRKISQEEIKKVLNYDPITGVFTWKHTSSIKMREGSIAGCICKDRGYSFIRINGTSHRAHRLAWIYVYGDQEEFIIDHINHNKIDNRISNLRKCTHKENMKNQKIPLRNTSGFTGVSYDKRKKKYWAHICVDQENIHLGTFLFFEEAVSARKAANIKYGFHENHGI